MTSKDFAEAKPTLTIPQARAIAAEHHLEREFMEDGLLGLDLVSTENGLLVKTSSFMEWLGY
jgi:hypothetical protein